MKNIVSILLISLVFSGCYFGGFLGPLNVRREVTISGLVIDQETERIVQGAMVTIEEEGATLYSLSTNQDGRFSQSYTSLNSLASIQIEHPDYWPHVPIHINTHYPSDETYRLIPATTKLYTLRGAIDYALPQVSAIHSLSTDSNERMRESPIFDAVLPTEILVYLHNSNSLIAAQLQRALGTKSYRKNAVLGAIVFTIHPHQDIHSVIEEALAHPDVMDAFINYPTMSFATVQPDDPRYLEQWNLPAIYLPQAWSWVRERAKQPITVAVLDSGIDTLHPDLQTNFDWVQAYNTIDDNADIHYTHLRRNPRSHGTHVSGIIGATANNRVGITGAVWDVTIIPIKVLPDKQGMNGTFEDLLVGLAKAISLNVDIINLSLGIMSLDDRANLRLHEQILAAVDKGIVVVAAAGNQTEEAVYPAKYPEVIAVGGTTIHQTVGDYSATEGVGLFAPGGGASAGILSTDAPLDMSRYSSAFGTSMAAPLVTATVALMKSVKPHFDPTTVEDLLQKTGIGLSSSQPEQRLLNAYAAITGAYIENVQLVFTNVEHPDLVYDMTGYIDEDRTFETMLPAGTYQLTAYIDVNRNGLLDAGDWYTEQVVVVHALSPNADLYLKLDIF